MSRLLLSFLKHIEAEREIDVILTQQTKTNNLLHNIPIIGMFEMKSKTMAKNTSILLGDYFDNFINKQIKAGKFSSASEVVRAALRMFEYEEARKAALIKELKKGEKSGFVEGFDRKKFLNSLHQKHAVK